MNAYELAEAILPKPTIPMDVEWLKSASNMLRQQADRIAELEKAKTLTDEEILKLYVNNSTYDNDQKLFIDIYGFAKAILRKAQEK
jgi:hypothetical protein